MTENVEWDKFEQDVERRLQEGNVTEDEMEEWLYTAEDFCNNNKADAERFLGMCEKLRFTNFSTDGGSEARQKKRKDSLKAGYSELIFRLAKKRQGHDSEVRNKAWKTYKDIITSEKSVPQEGCDQVFEYLKGDINKEDDALLKKDISDTAFYLMSKYSDSEEHRRGLFAIYEALANKQIDNHKCFELVNHIINQQSYSIDEAKTMFSICDEIIEQNPLLRKHAVKFMEELYRHAEYRDADGSAHVRYNNILYRIAANYPILKNQIENDIIHREVKEPRYDKLPDKEWIHIGAGEKPCDEKFNVVHADGVLPNIRGGLYVAPKTENGLSEWNNWFVEAGEQDYRSGNIYYLEPKEDAKCLVVYAEKDIKPYLVADYSCKKPTIDAKALAKDYDCVYMGISEGKFGEHFGTNFNVSSLIFLKPNTFDAYTEEEWGQHKVVQKKINDMRQLKNPQTAPEKTTDLSANICNRNNDPKANGGFDGR